MKKISNTCCAFQRSCRVRAYRRSRRAPLNWEKRSERGKRGGFENLGFFPPQICLWPVTVKLGYRVPNQSSHQPLRTNSRPCLSRAWLTRRRSHDTGADHPPSALPAPASITGNLPVGLSASTLDLRMVFPP